MAGKVRAKFVVTSVVYRHDHQGNKPSGEPHVARTATVEMRPVYHKNDPAHENTKFWKATPSGLLQLQVVDPEAIAPLEPGREFYIDMIPAS